MNQPTAATLATMPTLSLMQGAPTRFDAEEFWRPVGAARLSTGLARLLAAAQHGIAAAQNCLGEAYGTGNGVQRDDHAALVWIRKAARQGYAPAQNNLGFIHARGRGVAQDELQAMNWFRKAAEQGHADALHNLGALHANGRGGVRQDVVLAYVLFSLAAAASTAAAVQRRYLQPRLSREQFAESRAMLRGWKRHTALPVRSKTGLVLH